MKGLKFSATIGVIEGYKHNNKNEKNESFEEIYQNIVKEAFENTGIYVSAIIIPSKTIYHTDWASPIGGENTFTITGVANPELLNDTDFTKWKETVKLVIKRLKNYFKQSTVTLEIWEIEIYYLK